MLIIAIRPSLVCPSLLRKYNLHECRNTFKVTSQDIFQTSIPLFKFCLYNHSVSYLSFMYLYRINTNIFYLIFSCENVLIFYRQELESMKNEKRAGSHSEIFWVDVCRWQPHKNCIATIVIFSEHDVLHLWDNVCLLKYYLVKVPQNCFDSFSCSKQKHV